jgi:hypothetical protein
VGTKKETAEFSTTLCRKTFPRKVRGTADPSTARRDTSVSLPGFFLSAPGKDGGGPARCGLQWLKSSERHG